MNILKNKQNLFSILSVLGSLLVIVGSLLPWITFLGNLQIFPGIAGLNGKILCLIGSITLVLALLHSVKKKEIYRWIIGLLGFVQLAFSSYLLFNLYNVFHTLSNGMNSMLAAKIGYGLFILELGALLLFCTLFVPIQQTESRAIKQ